MQLLRIGGAGYITILEPLDKKREFALKSGADAGLNPVAEGETLTDKIRAIYGGRGADIAYECAGSPQAFQSLLGAVRRDGQVLLLGVTDRETTVVESALIRGETEIEASFIFNNEDINICLDLLSRRRFNTEGIVYDIISLDGGMERLVAPEEALIKVVVAP